MVPRGILLRVAFILPKNTLVSRSNRSWGEVYLQSSLEDDSSSRAVSTCNSQFEGA